MTEKNDAQQPEAPEKMHLECLVHAAEQAFLPSADRTPQPGDWGCASYYDGPPAFCGAGMVGFYWFATKDEMARCLGEHGAFLSPGLGDDELPSVLGLKREIGAYLGDGRVAPEKACEAFNKLLAGITKFPWIGPFDELYAGDTEYARNLRGQFRDHLTCYDDDFDDENEDAAEGSASPAADRQAPITEAERERFIEFLVEYGI